jgi:hypothetical protein
VAETQLDGQIEDSIEANSNPLSDQSLERLSSTETIAYASENISDRAVNEC